MPAWLAQPQSSAWQRPELPQPASSPISPSTKVLELVFTMISSRALCVSFRNTNALAPLTAQHAWFMVTVAGVTSYRYVACRCTSHGLPGCTGICIMNAYGRAYGCFVHCIRSSIVTSKRTAQHILLCMMFALLKKQRNCKQAMATGQ